MPTLMKRNTRRLSGIALALAASGVLAACSSGSSNSGTAATSGPNRQAAANAADHPSGSGYLETSPAWDNLTFTIGDNGGDGSQALAADTGIFKNAGYKVKFARFTYGPPLVQAAASGDISIGSVGDVPPITGAAKEYGFKIVAVERSLYPNQADEDIIVPDNSPIHSLAELKGHSIAVPQGSSAHGLVLLALESVGLKPSDVHIDFLSPAAGATAYQSGQVDAWAIWNPQLAIELRNGSRVLAEGLPPIDQTSSYYVASDKLLDNPVDRAAVTNLLERISYDWAWGNKHPQRFAEALASEEGIPVADAQASIHAFQYTVTPIRPSDITLEQSLANAFLSAGQITTKVNLQSITENILPANFNSEQQLSN
jgi:sulfonate transport system substrate-binding protein